MQSKPFELSAHVYDRIHKNKNYDAHAAIALSFLRPHFPQDRRGRILEWGAGTGEFTKRLSQHAEVTAIEPCDAMAAIASQKGIYTNHGDVRTSCYLRKAEIDAQALLFATFSYACLRVDDIDATLSSLQEIAKPSSGLVFDVINYAAAHACLLDSEKRSPCETVSCSSRRTFDFTDSILTCENTYKLLPDGQQWVEVHKMRAFTPAEITGHLRRHGFVVKEFFDPENGGTCIKHCPFYFGVHAIAV